MDINNIYLISNDDSLTEKKINSIPILNNDIVVLFNHANPLKFQKIANHTNKWLFLRTGDIELGYWGAEHIICDSKLVYQKLIFINTKQQYINLISKIYTNYTIISGSENRQSVKYPLNKYMTSGFIAFLYLKKMFDISKFVLVNFTGNGSLGKSGWSQHDYVFEQNYYKANHIKML